MGAVERNLRLAEVTQAVIQRFFDADGRFLDYGGGYGLFVRLMRDRGFDFRWSDRYASNGYAIGFEALPDERDFTLLTAFEVFEHLADPVAGVDDMVNRGGAILFTTELLPDPAPRPGEWWYYATSGGQHVAFYTRTALEALGTRFGLALTTDGRSTHVLAPKSLNAREFALLTKLRVARVVNRFRRRTSLKSADFRRFNTMTGETNQR